MVLIIDIGNTSLKAAVFSSNKKPLSFYCINGKDKINNLFKSIKSKYDIASCYICSVRPSMNKSVICATKLIFNIDAQIIKNQEFKNELDLSEFNINEIGTDILAYALFLKKKYKKCIGFCYGTAVFVIGVDNRRFYGAIISPVPSAGVGELIRKTELIPTKYKAINASNFFEFGANTLESLISGLNHYHNGIVLSIVNYLGEKFNFKNVCLTGGNAPKVQELKGINRKINFFNDDNAIILGVSYLVFDKNKAKKDPK